MTARNHAQRRRRTACALSQVWRGIGGEALLNDGGDANGLQVTLADGWSSSLPMPAVACPNGDSASTGSAEGSGALGSATACDGNALYLLKDMANPGAEGSGANNDPQYSWTPGTNDSITVDWNLPITAPNTYQGGSAEIVLQGQAVQASNNGLISGTPGLIGNGGSGGEGGG